jgi:hypothetical protein
MRGRPVAPLLLLRPPIGLLRAPRIRGFSASAAANLGLSTPFEVTSHVLHCIHDVTGLTYGITIPLAAILLRAVVTLPMSIYGQRALNKRLELRPLLYRWGSVITRLSILEFKHKNPQVDLKANKEAGGDVSKKVQKAVCYHYKIAL